MSLKEWESNGWLRKHKTSKQEIADLLEIVDRDLKDAAKDVTISIVEESNYKKIR